MAQTYKVSGAKIESAYTWSGVYTCPIGATAMINSVYLANRNTGTPTMADMRLRDVSQTQTYYLLSGYRSLIRLHFNPFLPLWC